MVAACWATAAAQATWGLETTVNAGSGDFAPYYIGSNVHGTVNGPLGAYERASIDKAIDKSQRFSWGFGADLIAGGAKGVAYERYDEPSGTWSKHTLGLANIWLQQLYAEVKYRGVHLTVGPREYESELLDSRLSSGDISFSGNTRPMPGFRAGFIDFQDVPLTNGWLQIEGQVGYARMIDADWADKHFNRYTGHYTTGLWYNYKRCYFRTKPSQPLSLTIGMQATAQFSGDTQYYRGGVKSELIKHPFSLKYALKMMLPMAGEDYYPGSHNGSWDVKVRYRLASGTEISAYYQSPWEDGSGIGKLNGFDGLWGLEYRNAEPQSALSAAVIEYIDFTNQSGPIHWDPVDVPGTDLLSHTTGMDNYYNNNLTNGYAYYGMSIGSPMIISPYYNLRGQNNFICTRMRGIHLGAEGRICAQLGWRALWSWRKGWGNYNLPFIEPRTDTSMMVECVWQPQSMPRLKVKGQLAFDAGSLYGDNVGALVSVTYTGNLNFGKK